MDIFTPTIPQESAVFLPRFQTKAGEKSIDACRIMYLKAQINYTMFYLSDGEQVITTLSLSTYARLLEPLGFMRIHKSCLINKLYLPECRLIKNRKMILADHRELPIARRKRSTVKKIKRS